MWLPRIIAKARLLESGALPAEYADRFCHPTGVDAQFLRFFELKQEDVSRASAERMSRSLHGSASCRLRVPRSFHSGTSSRQIWVVPAFPWRSASRSHSPPPTNTWNPQNSVRCSRLSKPMKVERRRISPKRDCSELTGTRLSARMKAHPGVPRQPPTKYDAQKRKQGRNPRRRWGAYACAPQTPAIRNALHCFAIPGTHSDEQSEFRLRHFPTLKATTLAILSRNTLLWDYLLRNSKHCAICT